MAGKNPALKGLPEGRTTRKGLRRIDRAEGKAGGAKRGGGGGGKGGGGSSGSGRGG